MRSMRGYITDIQRFSLNDGDGIRTTVFFKGCNLHCTWCHNPETIAFENEIMLYKNNCIGCGRCFNACSHGAQIVRDDEHVVEADRCVHCGACVDVCFAGALRPAAKVLDTDEIMDEAVQDILYYEQSGGGVTLSGGEVFCQAEFARELVDKCRLRGISVAAETNLCYDFEKVSDIISKLDLLMFDIKLFDPEMHKKYTGADNRLVFENAAAADMLGVPMIVRTPLIPGVTDDIENLTHIAEFVKGLKNVRYYELLNFNPLGGSKYKALGRRSDFAGAKPLSHEQLEKLRTALADFNIKIS